MGAPCSTPVEGKVCTYPRLVMPSGGLSRMCYWHRIMRTSLDAQVREAARRREGSDPERRPTRVPAAQWPDGERWCSGCFGFVPLFYCKGSRCRGCATEAARATRRLALYGTTRDDTAILDEYQGGRCAACRSTQRSKAPATDHDHKTGAPRGLLCENCNRKMLGGAFDSARRLVMGASYLVLPPTSGQWLDPDEYGDEILRGFLAMLDDISTRRRPRPLDAQVREISQRRGRA